MLTERLPSMFVLVVRQMQRVFWVDYLLLVTSVLYIAVRVRLRALLWIFLI